MNFKDLTEYIAEEEGLKESVNIAQIREILRITLSLLANSTYSELGKLLKRYEE